MEDNLEEDPFAPEEAAHPEGDFDDAFDEQEQGNIDDAFEQEAEDQADGEDFGFNDNAVDGFANSEAGVESAADPVEEDAPLKEFDRKWQEELARKDEMNKTKREKMKAEAQKELATFNEQRLKKIAAKRAANKEEESAFAAKIREAEESHNPWERTVSLVDINNTEESEDRSDVSRLRSLLIQLKNAPQATQGAE